MINRIDALKVELPRVYIPLETKQRLDLYIQCCDHEISGLGTVRRRGKDFVIDQIYLFEQNVTAASTNLDPKDLSKFLVEIIGLGQDPEEIKFWWHSHASMDVFWSSTDENTIALFKNQWMISLVGNKAGAYLVRVDIYSPWHHMFDLGAIRILYPDNPVLEEEIRKEIERKVKAPQYPSFVTNLSSLTDQIGRSFLTPEFKLPDQLTEFQLINQSEELRLPDRSRIRKPLERRRKT